jgi:hypothetical protein
MSVAKKSAIQYEKMYQVESIVYSQRVNGEGNLCRKVNQTLARFVSKSVDSVFGQFGKAYAGPGETTHLFLQQVQEQCKDGTTRDTFTYGSILCRVSDDDYPDVYPIVEDAEYVHTIPDFVDALRAQKLPMPCHGRLTYGLEQNFTGVDADVYSHGKDRGLYIAAKPFVTEDNQEWARIQARAMLDSITAEVDARNKATIAARTRAALKRAEKKVVDTDTKISGALAEKFAAMFAVKELTEKLREITIAEATGTLADAEFDADPEEYDYFSDNDSA